MGRSRAWGSVVVVLVAASTVRPSAVGAQDVGVAAYTGTLGLGMDVAVSVTDLVGLRGGISGVPFDINVEADGVDYDLELPSPRILLVADFHPTGPLRLSGGLMISTEDFRMDAQLREPVEIGNDTYTPAEVGTLTGNVAVRNVSPYVGIGVGNPTAKRIGLFFEAGAAFHGNPDVSAEADGPISTDPGFQADLDAEVRDIQDDVENLVVYPVLSLGVSVRLGGR